MEASGDRPLDLLRIMNIHVRIDHDRVLDVVMRRERPKKHVLGFALLRLPKLDVEMIASDAAK